MQWHIECIRGGSYCPAGSAVRLYNAYVVRLHDAWWCASERIRGVCNRSLLAKVFIYLYFICCKAGCLWFCIES